MNPVTGSGESFPIPPSSFKTIILSLLNMIARRTRRILVAPLDWGLGHAARCVPLVRALLARGHEVMTAGDNGLIREAFPSVPSLSLTPYDMTYAASPLCLMLKFPAMISRVWRRSVRERRELNALIDRHRIEVVISDQRFGCHSPKAVSIYMTHQLCVKMPRGFGWFEPLLARGLRYAANRFNEVWIPDFPGGVNLTGDLTRKHPLPRRYRFIGPLSRFGYEGELPGEPEKTDLLVMISGPEPQRSLFEKQVLPQVAGFKGRAVVLLGRPGTAVAGKFPPNISVFPHLPMERIGKLILGAGAIVCRGGYTTVMELFSLRKKALLVPTPGQTEQEYLCEYLAGLGLFAAMPQDRFDLREGMEKLDKVRPGFALDADDGLLREAFDAWDL